MACINLRNHNFVAVKKTWQNVDYARYQVLENSKELMVCSQCGEIIDPWPEPAPYVHKIEKRGPWYKLWPVLPVLLLLITSAALQAQTNAFAYGYFTAPDGNLALVNLVRTQDPTTKQITTQLFYTFCGQAGTNTSCQRGDGTIPNNSVQGTVLYDRTKPDTMRVTVDTSTVAGYHNQLCTQGIDYDAQCLGEVPATGGPVVVTWTRTQASANLYTSSASQYVAGKLQSAVTSRLGIFSANQTGTVLGVSAAASGAVMSTSTNSQTLQAQFAARKVAGIKRQQ